MKLAYTRNAMAFSALFWQLGICTPTPKLTRDNKERGIAGGPYSIKYYAALICADRANSLGCGNIPAFWCCEAPPATDVFRAVSATSSGPPGILVFTENNNGNCGNCDETGSLNTCYINYDPFHTTFVASIPYSCPRQTQFEKSVKTSKRTGDQMDNIPAENKKCTGKARLNVATVDGFEYDITSESYDAIIADVIALSSGSSSRTADASAITISSIEFAAKWGHLRRNSGKDTAIPIDSSISSSNVAK